ncbi:hypothetical protein MMC17_003264 [Xylographa soralifera]|nr:hypothetical protein [Xylographa soralifera]
MQLFKTLAVTGLSIAGVVTAYGPGYDRENLYARDLDFGHDDLYARSTEPYADLYERDIDDQPYHAGYKRDTFDEETMAVYPRQFEEELYRRALVDDYLSSFHRRGLVARIDDATAAAMKAEMRGRKTSYNVGKDKEDERKAKKAKTGGGDMVTQGNPDEAKYAEHKIAHKHFHP